MKILKQLLSGFLIAILLISAVPITLLAEEAETENKESRSFVPEPGTNYTVNVTLMKADQDTASMGNNALNSEAVLIVEADGTMYIQLELSSMETLGMEGYLGWINKLDKNSIGYNSYGYPVTYTLLETLVAEYFDLVDSYNDPTTGTDANLKGKQYPKCVQIPVDEEDLTQKFYVEIYVPVMEVISTGSGKQLARLEIDTSQAVIDKTDLKELLDQAETILDQSDQYTQASIQTLQDAYYAAKTVYEDAAATQDDITTQYTALYTAVKGVATVDNSTTTTVDKTALKALLDSIASQGLIAKTDTYTEASLTALSTAYQEALKIYNNSSATQSSVDNATTTLQAAKGALVELGTDLDKDNLASGIYKVYGEMVKINRTDKSMANEAINHWIMLTVAEDGTYYLTLDLNGITISSSFGYLSKLSYYIEGYSYDTTGNPKGTLKDVTVVSWQAYSDGSYVIDEYNDADNLYPDEVQFELVSSALTDDDGYVPMQVNVPIMDAISSGSGTQDVLLQLDWTTLAATTEEDEDLQSDTTNDPTSSAFEQTVNDVTVTADAGVIPDGATLHVEKVTSGTDYTNTQTALAATASSFVLYEIYLTVDGETVEPNGYLSITMPIESSYDESQAAVYYINGTSAVYMSGTVSSGYYTFKTNHLSLWAMAQKISTTGTNTAVAAATTAKAATAAKATTATAAKTGDETPILFYGSLLAASLGVVFLIYRKRIRKRISGIRR